MHIPLKPATKSQENKSLCTHCGVIHVRVIFKLFVFLFFFFASLRAVVDAVIVMVARVRIPWCSLEARRRGAVRLVRVVRGVWKCPHIVGAGSSASGVAVVVVIIARMAVVVPGMCVRVACVRVRVTSIGIRVRRRRRGLARVAGDCRAVRHRGGVGSSGGVAVARLVLVVRGQLLADGGDLRVAVGHVVGLGVCGEGIGVVLRQRVLAAAAVAAAKDAAEEACPALRRLGLVVAVRVLGKGHLHLRRRVGEALLAVVVAAERQLDKEREDVEEDGNDGNGETRRLELARGAVARDLGEAGAGLERVLGLAAAKDGGDVAGAAARAALVGDGNKDIGAEKGEIETHGGKGGESAAGEAAEQQQAKQGVGGGDAGDALDGLYVRRRRQRVVGEGGEEVGVDAEDDDGAQQLHAAEEPLDRLEAERGASGHGDGGDAGFVCMRLCVLGCLGGGGRCADRKIV